MEPFYTKIELQGLGLKAVGNNVMISRKASIYGAEKISIGDNVRIDDFCLLSGHIEIGSYIHIAAYTALYGGSDGIFVSDFANLSSRVCVYSVCDDFSGMTMTDPMVPVEYKHVKSGPVYINRHVIVGTTSVILPGLTLAEGSAFGSFSFINHDSDPWSINVGIPFQKVRERKRDLLALEQRLRAQQNDQGILNHSN